MLHLPAGLIFLKRGPHFPLRCNNEGVTFIGCAAALNDSKQWRFQVSAPLSSRDRNR